LKSTISALEYVHLLFQELIADDYQHDQKRHIVFEQSDEKEYRKQAKPDVLGEIRL
jgi:hypothetical protein